MLWLSSIDECATALEQCFPAPIVETLLKSSGTPARIGRQGRRPLQELSGRGPSACLFCGCELATMRESSHRTTLERAVMNARRLYPVILLSAGLLYGVGALAKAGAEPTPQSSSKSMAGKSDESKSKAETFSIDPTHSMAMFRIRHGASMFWGRFNKITGTVSYDPDSESSLSLDITMAIDSVDSGNGQLDGHLKSEEFFYAEKYPTATFKSSSSTRVGEKTYGVSGKLTMRGVTKPITVRVDWLGTSESRRGKTCGLETEFTVKRSEFGINYGVSMGMLGDETKIIVAIEAKAGGADEAGAPRGGRLAMAISCRPWRRKRPDAT